MDAIPENIRRRLAAAITRDTDLIVAKALAEVHQHVPEVVGGLGKADYLRPVVADATAEHATSLALGLPAVPAGDSPAAQRLAQDLVARDVSVDSFYRATQISRSALVQHVLTELDAIPGDRPPGLAAAVVADLEATGRTIVASLLQTFQRASDTSARGRAAGLIRLVQAILDGDLVDPDTATRSLRYPLAGPQTCLLFWDAEPSPLDRLTNAEHLAAQLPGVRRVLAVPHDQSTLICWLAIDGNTDITRWRPDLLQQTAPSTRAAAASAGPGIDGFREALKLARACCELLRNSSPQMPRIVFHKDVAPLIFLSNDPANADQWTRDTLGALGQAGERATRLRTALHLWLTHGRDARAASTLLSVHPNTIKYRVAKAVELLPPGSDTNHLDLRLALEYRRWTHG